MYDGLALQRCDDSVRKPELADVAAAQVAGWRIVLPTGRGRRETPINEYSYTRLLTN